MTTFTRAAFCTAAIWCTATGFVALNRLQTSTLHGRQQIAAPWTPLCMSTTERDTRVASGQVHTDSNLSNGQNNYVASSTRTRKRVIPRINNEKEYKETLARFPDDMLVFRLYTSWSSACEELNQDFIAVSRKYAGVSSRVRFYDIDVGRSSSLELQQYMTVNKVPSVIIRAGQKGEVENRFMDKRVPDPVSLEGLVDSHWQNMEDQ